MKHFKALYQGFLDDYSGPTEDVFLVIDAETEEQAKEMLKGYKPEFKKERSYDLHSEHQTLKEISDKELSDLTELCSKVESYPRMLVKLVASEQ